MVDNDTALDAVFDIENGVIPAQENSLAAVTPACTAIVAANTATVDEQLSEDLDFARTQIYDIIKKGSLAMDSAIVLAQSGDSPKSYDAVASIISAMVQANQTLIGMHKTKRSAEAIQNKNVTKNPNLRIDKAVFIGTASDLIREIQKIQKTSKEQEPVIREIQGDVVDE